MFAALMLMATRGALATGGEAKAEQRAGAGEERNIELVYIGASYCGPCKTPEMKEAIKQARAILSKWASSQGATFGATAVVMDERLEAGLEYLREFEPFDEVIIGRGFRNTGMANYVGRYPDGIAGVPQVVLVLQRWRKGKTQIRLVKEEILTKVIGTGILQWVQGGAKIVSGWPRGER